MSGAPAEISGSYSGGSGPMPMPMPMSMEASAPGSGAGSGAGGAGSGGRGGRQWVQCLLDAHTASLSPLPMSTSSSSLQDSPTCTTSGPGAQQPQANSNNSNSNTPQSQPQAAPQAMATDGAKVQAPQPQPPAQPQPPQQPAPYFFGESGTEGPSGGNNDSMVADLRAQLADARARIDELNRMVVWYADTTSRLANNKPERDDSSCSEHPSDASSSDVGNKRPCAWGGPPDQPQAAPCYDANNSNSGNFYDGADGPKKLRKSCDFCAHTKSKCSGGRPSCENCTKRGIACNYSIRRRPGPKPTSMLDNVSGNMFSLARLQMLMMMQQPGGDPSQAPPLPPMATSPHMAPPPLNPSMGSHPHPQAYAGQHQHQHPHMGMPPMQHQHQHMGQHQHQHQHHGMGLPPMQHQHQHPSPAMPQVGMQPPPQHMAMSVPQPPPVGMNMSMPMAAPYPHPHPHPQPNNMNMPMPMQAVDKMAPQGWHDGRVMGHW